MINVGHPHLTWTEWLHDIFQATRSRQMYVSIGMQHSISCRWPQGSAFMTVSRHLSAGDGWVALLQIVFHTCPQDLLTATAVWQGSIKGFSEQRVGRCCDRKATFSTLVRDTLSCADDHDGISDDKDARISIFVDFHDFLYITHCTGHGLL